MKYSECPVFKATGKQKPLKGGECEVCPFTAKCPEDLLSDVTKEVMRQFGEYLAQMKAGRE